ncbi:hypothetical protein PINS_up001772 [Pythium insidiosum]|nr:hypothetical protein PINS_up001772 [Pythium insidiosum]
MERRGDARAHKHKRRDDLSTRTTVANVWDDALSNSDLAIDGCNGDHDAVRAVNDEDLTIQRIKQSFMLETHVFRERILEATDATARARERISDVQQETLRWRKKCFKLQKLLQEKEAMILSLQEQQDTKLSLLMHDTMESVQRAMKSNQLDDDDGTPPAPFGDSRLQLLRDQEVADAKLFEYEQQITKLYEELAEEKQRNEMLTECLQEQKQAKAKLLKACKVARKEIEAMKESGLHQMLDDLQQRCHALETQNSDMEDALQQEKTKVDDARRETQDALDAAEAHARQEREWQGIESYLDHVGVLRADSLMWC